MKAPGSWLVGKRFVRSLWPCLVNRAIRVLVPPMSIHKYMF